MYKLKELLENVLNDIENGLNTGVNIGILSEKYDYTERHLARIFKFVFKQTLGEYIRLRKLSASLNDLLNTDLNVIDIAYKYDFEFEQSYIRSFKREFGITPGEYRKTGQDIDITHPLNVNGDGSMAEIIKVYKQELPALRFIGKKYGDDDRVDGMYSKIWNDWFKNNWFDVIEKQTDKKLNEIYEDGDAYIGLMQEKDGEFEYWIGIFMPEGTTVPDGFEYIDFPKNTIGVCWVYGKEKEIYFHLDKCIKELEKAGFELTDWFMERYCYPRFTNPDKNGNIILDMCFCIT